MMGNSWECDKWQVCGVKGNESRRRETVTTGGEREERRPGLMTKCRCYCN